MSRLESGQIELELVPTNLVTLNHEVCDILERQAEERLVTIICDQQTLNHLCAGERDASQALVAQYCR